MPCTGWLAQEWNGLPFFSKSRRTPTPMIRPSDGRLTTVPSASVTLTEEATGISRSDCSVSRQSMKAWRDVSGPPTTAMPISLLSTPVRAAQTGLASGSIVAVAAAPVPPPPLNPMMGGASNHWPGLSTTTEVMAPFVTAACAVAPLAGVIVTLGALV